MLVSFLMLAGGFLLLLRGAHYLVLGASSLARRLGVSALVVGLTVVALGTSMPELVVNLFSAARGSTDIAVGNVLGRNIANIMLILGLAAIIAPITVQKTTIWKEIPFSILAVKLVFVMGNDVLFDGRMLDAITRIDGFVLLSFFGIFLYYVYGVSKRSGERGDPVGELTMPMIALYILGGLVALGIGGSIVVEGATGFARLVGLSDHVIAMTIVAIGTSLPEMATSLVAAYKKHTDIAIGNIIGSNIFNVFFVLGSSALVRPLPFGEFASRDAAMVIFASVFLFVSMFIGTRHRFDRWQGVAFVLTYLLYIGYILVV